MFNAFSAALADHVILDPTRHQINATERKPFRLAYDDGHLELWAQRSEAGEGKDSGPFVLKFPGTGSRAEDTESLALQCWEDRDVTLWCVNPPGYGNSSGRASLRHIPTMAMAAVSRIRTVADGRPIVAEGFSLGCVAALFLAAQGEVDGLLLRNPPPLREVVHHRTGWWSLGLLPALIVPGISEAIDCIRNAAACKVPALFITSLRDRIVPAKCQYRIVDAYSGPHQVLEQPDGGHGTPLSETEMLRLKNIADWLLDCLEKKD